MSAPALSPTDVFESFWAMHHHFVTLLESGDICSSTPGVESWDVHLAPAHEVVTFEHTWDNRVSISWITVAPETRQEEFNEILMRPKNFDLLFAKVLQ